MILRNHISATENPSV